MASPNKPEHSNSVRASSKRRPPSTHPKPAGFNKPTRQPKKAVDKTIPPIPKIAEEYVEKPLLLPKLDYVIIAEITAPFGLRGAVKANILTDFPERFDRLEEVFLAPPDAPLDATRVSYKVMSARLQNDKQVIIRLSGVGKTEEADKLRGYSVAVPIGEAVELPEGEYYIFQIIGLDVYTTADEYIGKVINVESRTANDIYVVRGPLSKKDVLLPAIKDVVKDINLEKGRITVELMEGLLEL